MSMAQLLLFMAVFWSVSTPAATYTLSDLEVLVNEKGHDEFFKHALDIRPSERQEAWKTMISKMGEIFTQSVLGQTEVKSKDFKQTESLYQWPVLQNDDVFKLKRQEIGLRYLTKCLKSSEPCWGDLKEFWEKDTKDSDLAYKLSELVSGFPNSPISTWIFLDVALKSPLSEFYCQKDFAMASLWGKFEIDYIRLGQQGDLLKKIDQTVHPDCLPALNKEATKKLYAPDKSQDRELAYQILKAQMKATQTVSDFFFTVYLLEKPSQGELFNYSWNRLKELGSSQVRREAVLNIVKTKLDPLPDEIFSSIDIPKKRVVLNHFKANFPEYLDFYSDQCVKFYGGKNTFPQGNPTVHCQDLMNSELAPEVLSHDKIKRYQEVINI